jgi:hypothetical protein
MSLTKVSSGVLNVDDLYGFRNRIINGDMRIDQRNAGAAVTASNSYTLDRWLAIQTNQFSVQRNAGNVTPPPGFTNYLGVTSLSAHSLAAGDFFQVKHHLEGFNVADFDWGKANASPITVSFWVRSSLTGNFGVVVSWGGAGSNQRSYPVLYSISSTNTWEYKTITIPGDTTMAAGGFETGNGSGIQLRFSLGGGATNAGAPNAWANTNFQTVIGDTSVVSTNGATFYITGVQLEKGTVATPFERRPFGTELALCQRYYFRLSTSATNASLSTGGFVLTSTIARGFTSFPVEMRTEPTALEQSGVASDYKVAYLGTAATCSSVPTFANASRNIAASTFIVASGLTAGHGVGAERNANIAFLGWSAEL